VRATPNENDRHGRVTQILAPDLGHYVLGIVAVDEVVVVKRAESFGREDALNIGPLVDKVVDFLLVSVVEGRNKYFALYWLWGRRRLQAS
jgi:hypothetical protein